MTKLRTFSAAALSAESAAWSAESAAWSAESARSAAHEKYADKLINLLEGAVQAGTVNA